MNTMTAMNPFCAHFKAGVTEALGYKYGSLKIHVNVSEASVTGTHKSHGFAQEPQRTPP